LHGKRALKGPSPRGALRGTASSTAQMQKGRHGERDKLIYSYIIYYLYRYGKWRYPEGGREGERKGE